MSEVKYPDVTVRLVGEDGNAFAIIGRVVRAMRQAGVPSEEIKSYQEEVTSGDYNNLLATTMRWVNCDGDEGDEEGLEDFEEEGDDDE